MKKLAIYFVVAVCSLTMFTSCATVFGGRVTEYQKTPPLPGQPQREIRVGALIADIILFWPGAVIDFATGAIYKPAPSKVVPADNTKTSME